jgi:predicted SAM-dependent methyltransferase
MNVLIILQTHNKGDNQHYLKLNDNKRYCGASKSEIQRRCTRSLIESINYAKDLFPKSKFELVVYDDHSDDSAIQELKNNLNIARFDTEFISLETYGIMPSILKCYEHGRDYGKEIVYFAQDDYLYEQLAIYEMVSTLLFTSEQLSNYTSIYPFNDPYRYHPVNVGVQSHIILGEKRYWRTQTGTASCFMTHHEVIKKEWDLFEAMGKHTVDNKMEDETINKLWTERGYYLFVPIPSVALHMQYESEKDPFINWREWWDKYDRPEPLLPNSDDTILNVGSGGIKISQHVDTADLLYYREISLDIDKKYNPDILADIHNISHIPDKFVNVVYTSHMIEHIHFFKVPSVIKEFLRIVKDGGLVRIITPNMSKVAEKLQSGDILDIVYESGGGPISSMDILYGSRYHTHKHNSDYMSHKCGFTDKVFKKLAEEYNFNLNIKKIGLDLVVDIYK